MEGLWGARWAGVRVALRFAAWASFLLFALSASATPASAEPILVQVGCSAAEIQPLLHLGCTVPTHTAASVGECADLAASDGETKATLDPAVCRKDATRPPTISYDIGCSQGEARPAEPNLTTRSRPERCVEEEGPAPLCDSLFEQQCCDVLGNCSAPPYMVAGQQAIFIGQWLPVVGGACVGIGVSEEGIVTFHEVGAPCGARPPIEWEDDVDRQG